MIVSNEFTHGNNQIFHLHDCNGIVIWLKARKKLKSRFIRALLGFWDISVTYLLGWCSFFIFEQFTYNFLDSSNGLGCVFNIARRKCWILPGIISIVKNVLHQYNWWKLDVCHVYLILSPTICRSLLRRICLSSAQMKAYRHQKNSLVEW